MPNDNGSRLQFPIRIDLHCHSNASSEAGEAVLAALNCPESYSEPTDVYDQAKRRGMDLVTITDHDSIDGVEKIAARPDVLVGEELTCFFPEDGCKMHVLLWGIDRQQHDVLQSISSDIYRVAEYLEGQCIAHAVAHPVYRQNDRLERWHLERLLVLFKGFECLNGAHSILHREAFEPLLDELTPGRLAEFSEKHKLAPLWPRPWVKARTGGSDDHGLFNIGRTWTEFPAGTATPQDVLNCIREGRCRPGGEAGSSLKLAHNFYGVGIRYLTRQMSQGASAPLLSAMVGERRLRWGDVAKTALKRRLAGIGSRIRRPFAKRPARKAGVAMLSELFGNSLAQHLRAHPSLIEALQSGTAPLAEHEAMWQLICQLTRDTSDGIASSIARAAQEKQLAPMFDALSAIACQQFTLLPYYFALFHQNRERHLLGRITGKGRTLSRDNLRLGIFTDTFDNVNGASRMITAMGQEAARRGHHLVVHTCERRPHVHAGYRKNFAPITMSDCPWDSQLSLNIPPLAELMQWADQQQFDAIHVQTPGPMGLCGIVVAAMLRVPLVASYHKDFPAFVSAQTGDHRLTTATSAYCKWFLSRAHSVLTPSHATQRILAELGVSSKVLPPCVDTQTFSDRHRDVHYWVSRKVNQPRRLLYCGRLSEERNLRTMADAFRQLCGTRSDTALVIAGDGPHLKSLRSQLSGLPAYFLGRLDDRSLPQLYANCDLLLFPSRTDTFGQVVLEAQACGLPVMVSDEGGPREAMDDGITGQVVCGRDPRAWATAITQLLDDEPRRQRMARTGPHRVSRCSIARTYDSYRETHLNAAEQAQRRHQNESPDAREARPKEWTVSTLMPAGGL